MYNLKMAEDFDIREQRNSKDKDFEKERKASAAAK